MAKHLLEKQSSNKEDLSKLKVKIDTIVRNAIIVIIVVAGVTLAIFVVVCLVGVGDVGAVVQIVLVTVLVNVLVVVALVSYAV